MRPPAPLPRRSRLAAPRAIDQRGRAETRQHLDQQYFAAMGFDDVAAYNLLAGIVAAFHQYARLDRGDQFDRGILFEDHHQIDSLQRRQHFGARALILHRTAITLQPPYRCVAVETDDQPIAGAPRRGQDLDVAGMQDVETTIGEADPQSVMTPILKMRGEVAA